MKGHHLSHCQRQLRRAIWAASRQHNGDMHSAASGQAGAAVPALLDGAAHSLPGCPRLGSWIWEADSNRMRLLFWTKICNIMIGQEATLRMSMASQPTASRWGIIVTSTPAGRYSGRSLPADRDPSVRNFASIAAAAAMRPLGAALLALRVQPMLAVPVSQACKRPLRTQSEQTSKVPATGIKCILLRMHGDKPAHLLL